jgi:transposase InsO family protein
MPWKKVSQKAPRWAFIETVLHTYAGFAGVCREHGISRKTGYKWWQRFEQNGRRGLQERSRRPRRLARSWPRWLHLAVQKLRRAHPTWGARKLCWALRQHWPRRALPHPRTLERWAPRVPRRHRARPGPCLPALDRQLAHRPNDVWTIDFKGWFRTADGTRIEPLTVRDLYSRQILLVRHVRPASDAAVRPVLARVFRRYGLPRTIRVDTGAPFGGCGALGLSTLSVWWLHLGVRVDFTRRAHPQDNGAHEQMHRILKAETAKPPAATATAQYRRFQRWRRAYNQARPHEALGLQLPAAHYLPSPRRYPRGLRPWHYPPHCPVRRVSHGGWIHWEGRRRLIGRAFAAEDICLRADDGFHRIFLGPHLIGELHPHDLGGLRPAHRSNSKT